MQFRKRMVVLNTIQCQDRHRHPDRGTVRCCRLQVLKGQRIVVSLNKVTLIVHYAASMK